MPPVIHARIIQIPNLAEGRTMSEPEQIQFACVGCGAFNPPKAEVCGGCGQPIASVDVGTRVRVAPPSRPASTNPYQPPLAPIAPARSFRIGSMLIWTALIAVCLAAFREHFALGVLASISMVPSTIWTSIRAGNRRAYGHPLLVAEYCETFVITALGTWGIFFSSAMAFSITMIGASAATHEPVTGAALGLIAGLGCALWLSTVFIKNGLDQIRREREVRFLTDRSRSQFDG